MKKVEIRQFNFAEVDAPKEQFGFLKIPIEHKLIRVEGENLEVSDGYHTFDELYQHRVELFIALCRTRSKLFQQDYSCWKSKLHSDGTMFEGWFILGTNTPAGEQITYHLPIDKWQETEFAQILEKAPEWDGHTSDDVLTRLRSL